MFEKSKIKFTELYTQSTDFLTEKYEQAGRQFSMASAWGMILQTIQKLSELNFFYIEDSINELNIETATRPESIFGLSRLTGHNPTRGISATGEIEVKFKNKEVMFSGTSIIIPNWTKLICRDNGLPYLITLPHQQVRVQATNDFVQKFKIIQGEIEAQRFTGTGEDLQSFEANLRGGNTIENYNIRVFVNGDEWMKYESLHDMTLGDEGYIVKTGITSGVDIFFGTKYKGKVPANGSEITVEYIVTAGFDGNISNTAKPSFIFSDDGYDTVGNEIDLNEGFKIDVSKEISFGSSPEDLRLTRLLAPYHGRSFLLSKPENFIYFLRKWSQFSVIDAFQTYDDDYLDDDNVMYIFLIPDINVRMTDSEDYFTIDQSKFTFSNAEKEKVLTLINASGTVANGLEVTLVDPIIKKYIINISLVTYRGYSREIMHQEIVDKVSQYFQVNQRRDRIPKSDLIRLIEDVHGVDSVNIAFLSEENEQIKRTDPSAEDIGLDEFNDIIIGRGVER
jgi:hypothetical protein